MNSAGIIFLDERPRVRRRSGFLGVLGTVFSVFGIFTLGLLSPVGLGFSLLGMLRGQRGAATFGAFLGALGTGFLALWGWGVVAGITAVDVAVKSEETAAAMQTAVDKIEAYTVENGRAPEGIEGNMLLIEADLNDAWGESLRYDALEKNAFAIRSAGPDKKFDTADDLTRS
jgi:hypothetical protein